VAEAAAAGEDRECREEAAAAEEVDTEEEEKEQREREMVENENMNVNVNVEVTRLREAPTTVVCPAVSPPAAAGY
jgi:flagellar motor switch/type III secretory pathway protein FliN